MATITETLTPNPADPGATVTVTGTVTNADGSPGAGTVQLYVSIPLSLTTMHSNQTMLQLSGTDALQLSTAIPHMAV